MHKMSQNLDSFVSVRVASMQLPDWSCNHLTKDTFVLKPAPKLKELEQGQEISDAVDNRCACQHPAGCRLQFVCCEGCLR